ncbi:hypothetical protein K443DRAFT_648267 [Laccaria amethystina LaAM-08-1]|uniref:Uncharacterized protein n=1 Tax=Laccaria amethystina LaAM-08-1 TaxID=1095629 RepID=A0A0C9X8L9_9AGAR|nr:hypothetical protein K443DRAFT_648267 [Laccaria amethystina LaAM-08-1]
MEVYMSPFSFPCRVFRFLATSATRCGGERAVNFAFRTLTLSRAFSKKTEIEFHRGLVREQGLRPCTFHAS